MASDRYNPGEVARLVGKFTHSATVTITITKLSDDSVVATAAACSEIGSTGYFQYDYTVLVADEYLWVMTDSITSVSNSFVVSGSAATIPSIVGTWTFASDFSLVRDQIRSMVGDIDSNDPLISDEAIAFNYAQAGTLAGGALRSARAAAAKLALEFDKNLDGLSTSRSQRHKAMLNVIAALEDEEARELSSFTYVVPDASETVGDSTKYPVDFEPSDLSGPGWD